jgi:hypothetical protein
VYGSLEEALGSRVEDPEAGSYPVQASSELLSAVAFPPRRELAGLRTRRPPTFDVTPETSGAVTLGTVVTPSLGEAGSFSLSHDALNRHAFVCGATGSGKSQTIRTLLEQLSRAPEPVPWLVVEPAKAEYRKMAGRLAGSAPVIVIRLTGLPASDPPGPHARALHRVVPGG